MTTHLARGSRAFQYAPWRGAATEPSQEKNYLLIEVLSLLFRNVRNDAGRIHEILIVALPACLSASPGGCAGDPTTDGAR